MTVTLATALAVAAVAVLMTAMTQAAPGGWFLRLPRNLSSTAERWSVYPDMAVDGDGDPLVVVWIEEHDGLPNSGYLGHVHLRAASASSGGWANKVSVYNGSSSACASYKAAVAVTGTTAHVAYVVQKPCTAPAYTELHYNTCEIAAGAWQCGTTDEVITSTMVEITYVTSVDIAVDADGDPHLVWAQYYKPEGDKGKIYYQAKSGGIWGGIETVDGSGSNGAPAIAWANGYDHVVWEHQSTAGGDAQQIRYGRRGSGGWGSRVLFDYQVDITEPGSFPPSNPDVAAGGGYVYAVWGVRYDDLIFPTSREAYVVIYRYSSDDGQTFPGGIRQVHPNNNPGDSNMTPYDPIDNDLLGQLQPAIALSDDYLPGVAWHAVYSDTTEVPSVYYSYWISGTGWTTPTVLVSDADGLGVGAAAVAMAKEDDGTPFLHVAYMRKLNDLDWDVYYGSGSEVMPDYPTIYLPLVLRNS